jgi:hypothetical protein
LREEWINVNVGRPDREEENVVHGDVDEVAEIVSAEASFKGESV